MYTYIGILKYGTVPHKFSYFESIRREIKIKNKSIWLLHSFWVAATENYLRTTEMDYPIKYLQYICSPSTVEADRWVPGAH